MNNINILSKSPLLLLALLLVCVFPVTGCRAQFISDYDDVLDNGVTTLQTETETFLNQIDSEKGTPAAAFSANKDFYIKTDASLRTMATRAASQPKSTIIVNIVQDIENTFDDLKKLHQLDGDRGLSSDEIAHTRSALESEFKSFLTLELALKSSSGVPSSALAPAKTK